MEITNNQITDKSAYVVTLKCGRGLHDIIWLSDLHNDSTKFNFKFLDQVLRKYPDALLIIGGDHLDVMQNWGDKRAMKSGVREEFNKDTYLNEIIDHNVDLWGKYAKKIICFFVGNHEIAQLKYHGIDITREIVKNLNLKHNTNILLGDLAGWLKLRFDNGGRKHAKNIYYSHKPLAGGTRSKGMLSVDLIKGRYPDADIFISEHIHDTWVKPERVERLNGDGKITYDIKWVLQMPTLKDEYVGTKRGFAHSRNFGATPIGVIVLQFDVKEEGIKFSPKYELVE